MHEWPLVRLRELLTQVSDLVVVEPGADYPHFGIYSYARGLFRKQPIQGSAILAKKLNRVRTGQFIYARLNAYEGAFSLISDEYDGSYVSDEFPYFECDTCRINPRFLFLYFSRPHLWSILKNKVTGIGGGAGNRRIRLKEDVLLQEFVPIPPLAEQERIVIKIESLIRRLDEIRRLRHGVRDDNKALLHSVFHRLIQDAAYRPLAEVAPILRRPVEIELDGAYPGLGARSFGKGTFHKPTLIGADLDWQKLFRVHAGDLVISNIKAWEGAIAVATAADHGRMGSHRYITCVAKEGLATPEFVCFYLLTNEGLEQIQAASPGSADRNRTLGMKRLERIAVPVPAIAKQQEFSALQAKITAIHQAQAASQSELDALLPAVLDKAFRGEL